MQDGGGSGGGGGGGGEIVARAGRYYRNARYLIVVMCVVGGLWFFRDGFYNYPRLNQEAIDKEIAKVEAGRGRPLTPEERADVISKTDQPHDGYDVPFNRTFGILLPPIGVALLVWTLYNSRGEYRLAGDTLHVPGHPPIHLDNIRKIDKRLWERKGIAYIEYEPASSTERRTFRLDDFVYQRQPIDAIFERIEAHVARLLGQPGTGDGSQIPTQT